MTEQKKKSADPSRSSFLEDARKLYESGALLDAAKLCQSLLAEEPQNSEVLLLLSLVAKGSGQHELAIQVAQAALQLNPQSPSYTLNLAHAYQSGGFLQEAMQAASRALELNPNLGLAHCLIGDIVLATGDRATARSHYINASRVEPELAHAYWSLGNLEAQQDQFAAAVEFYYQAVAVAPDWAEGYFALGYALHRLRDRDGAAAALRRALEIKPDFPEAMLNLGNLFHDFGELAKAASIYSNLIRVYPFYTKGYSNLGNTMAAMNRFKEAANCYHAALLLEPESSTVQHKLGNLLTKNSEWEEAEKCFQKALQHDPQNAEMLNDFGNLFYQQRRPQEAAALYRQALALKPSLALTHSNLGNALQDMGDYLGAIKHYEKSVQLDSTCAGSHYNLALAYLCEGKFSAGWREYEWRWEFKTLMTPRRNFRQPLWQGEDLTGKTILLHSEQGLGDTIQFIRYAPLVAARGGRVILEVHPRLRKLLSGMEGVSETYARGDVLPEFDWQCPLMSLPLAFGTTVQTIPAGIPYLHLSSTEIEKAREQWPQSGLRIGVAWAGNPKNKRNDLRALPLRDLLPLTGVPGVTFFSLQKGSGIEQLRELPGLLPIHDACSMHNDFSASAALLATLDLVITVDTSIAHLAGAMGKPVWILLQYIADWRWMRNRNDSPWYPTARLFRQKKAGDWAGVIDEVCRALGELAKDSSQKDGSGEVPGFPPKSDRLGLDPRLSAKAPLQAIQEFYFSANKGRVPASGQVG